MKLTNDQMVSLLQELEGDLRRREKSAMDLRDTAFEDGKFDEVRRLQSKTEGIRIAIDLVVGYRRRESA